MLQQILIGAALGAFVAVPAYFLRMLRYSGAVATFVLATVVYGFGGWQWTIPIFTFFLLSSLLTSWRKNAKKRFDTVFEKGGSRDAGQVAANGGVVGALVIAAALFTHPSWYVLSLVATAVVTADTWGTELGVLSRRTPRSILTGQKVAAGTSGGITIEGTVGGAFGAAVVTSTAFFFIPLPLETYLLIVAGGMFGSLLDSLLGATVQAQYHCQQCDSYTERALHCGMPAHLQRGSRHITNDAVNLLACILTVAGAALFL
ncbi:DUF92 domain-containing protein [bacterium]|nr:DUF92 domain-containing protein [bacterium]